MASDDRFRGQSTSDGRPVATASLSYDDVRGPYAGVSVTAGPTRENGVHLLRSVQYAGYAHRLASGLAIDVGVTNRFYTRSATIEYGRNFVQAYVGLIGRRMSGHLYFSPDYDGYGRNAAYAEVDQLLVSRDRWSLTSHLGLLAAPTYRGGAFHRAEVDGRIGLARQLGRFSASVNLVIGGPSYDDGRWRKALVAGLTHSF